MLGQWGGGDPLSGNPRYSSIRTLSQSGRTFSQLALDRQTGEKVSIKFTQRGWDEAQNKYMLRELLIHQELSACAHPHIVELKEVFLTPLHLAAVTEYVEGEDLQTFLGNTGGRVSEALGRFLFQQLVLALDFCHARGKVSRGVKLANTLLALSPGQLPLVKLADFGFSKDTGRHSAPASQVGTALFVPPEVMHNFNNSPYDGALVDVWACGIVLFMLLFGRHPCLRPEDGNLSEQQQMLALFTRTAASQFCLLPEEAASISPGCADLLGHMLRTDPTQRFTMSQVQSHPWFKQGLPEGAALMNATILAEAAARPLGLRQSPEAMAALVRQGQQIDPHILNTRFAVGAGGAGAAAAAAGNTNNINNSSQAAGCAVGVGGGGGGVSSVGPASAVNIPTNSPPLSSAVAGGRGVVGGGGARAAAAAAGGPVGNNSINPRVASSSGAAGGVGVGGVHVRTPVGSSMDEDQQQHMGPSWGAPVPSRLLIHSTSSSDKATGLQYKRQEQQMLDSGTVPPARFHMSESMSSNQGSFIQQAAAGRFGGGSSNSAAQLLLQQQQQQELFSVLESIPSAGMEENLAQQQSPQQPQHMMMPPAPPQQQQPQQQPQQFEVWLPQQQPLSSTTTSAGGNVAAAASPASVSHGVSVSAAAPAGSTVTGSSMLAQNMQGLGLQAQLQQQQAQLQALQQQQQQQQQAMQLQQRQQEMLLHQQQHQQQQQQSSMLGLNGGGPKLSLLNSADLETLLPPLTDTNTTTGNGQQQQQQQPAAVGMQEVLDKQNSFLQLLEGIDSLPLLPDGTSSVDALLNPAANPLLNTPIPEQYTQQQQQLQQHSSGGGSAGAGAAASGGAGVSSGCGPAAGSSLQQQQQQMQTQPPPPSDAAAAADAMGGVELPDDYAAFLVDEDDLAAVSTQGVAGQRKRVLSGAGAGVSSCSLDLRKLSDLLMGGSSMQLIEGSAWHKICKDVSFSRGGGAAGQAGAGGAMSGPAALGGGSGGGRVGRGSSPFDDTFEDDAGTTAAAADTAPAGGDGDTGDDDDLHALLGLRDMSITR